MRKLLFTLGCCLLTACASLDPWHLVSRHVVMGETPVGALDAAERADAFDFVWGTIDRAWLYPAMKGVDWKAVGERYRPRALAARDDEAFWRELDRMTAELADSHTRVESPTQYREIREHAGISLGVRLFELDGQVWVERVAPGSEAWMAGLRPGARVLRIGDELAMAWWQRALAAARPGSTQQTRLAHVNRALNTGAQGQVLAIEFERSDGRRENVQLARRRFFSTPGVQAMRLGSGIGYLRFSGFEESIRRRTLAALEDLRDTRGLILDLRDNGGGSIFFARALIEQFVSGEHRLAHVDTRSGKPVSVLFGLIDVLPSELKIRGRRDPLRQPLVVLINAGSASASELVAASLQGLGRAHLVGETSCGCLLGYLGYAQIPGGGALAYSEFGLRMADGREIEGRGLTPEVPVRASLGDLQSGRDPQYEAALRWIEEFLISAH